MARSLALATVLAAAIGVSLAARAADLGDAGADQDGIAREVDLDTSILAIEGDAEYGEYLSADCKTCHQLSGDDPKIPSIVGWPVEEFVHAMHAYKQKVRPNPIMQMMAGRLSDEEIAALAAYFNALE